MDVLITGAASALGRALVERLSASSAHRLRLTDRSHLDTDLDFRPSELDHGDGTRDLVKGVDTVVHNPFPEKTAASPADWMDACTRCTYNLFAAAAEAGVRRVSDWALAPWSKILGVSSNKS